MTHVINEECINCGACQEECPVEAVNPGDDIYQIDEELCIDCGACVAVCSVDAIFEI